MGCAPSSPTAVRVVQNGVQNGHGQNGHGQNGNVQQRKSSSSSESSRNSSINIKDIAKVENTVENAVNNTIQKADGAVENTVKNAEAIATAVPKTDDTNQVEPVKEVTSADSPRKDDPKYTEESLKNFLSLQQKLGELQKKNIPGQYQTQHKMLVSLYSNLQAAQKKVDGLKKQTEKEYKDVAYLQHPNVCAMFTNIYQLQSQIAKEQQEYMDALNRQEVAEKELNGIGQEYKALYTEVDALRKEYEELERLRKEEEKRLDEIFGGKYGSELEEQLEDQTELLYERKEMITTTRNRWNNAKILIEHAVSQLQYSTRRWAQINTVGQGMVQARYSMVAETRNYLIAASQNVTNTHRYLGNIDIPYCNSDDLKILNNSIGSIFNDIMTRDSYLRAYQTYQTLYARSSHLLQWVAMVLEKTINEDLKKIVPEYHEKVSELKRERLRLINVKLYELQGKDTDDVIVPEDGVIVDKEALMVEEVQSDTHVAQPDAVSLKEEEVENKDDVAPPPTTDDQEPLATDTHPPETTETHPPDATEAQPDTTETKPSETTEVQPPETTDKTENKATSVPATEKPKPLTELAPVPSLDTLFGNIEELKTKYEQQVAEFAKAQDVNKARVDQALEEKLRARKSRRIVIELDAGKLDVDDLEKGYKKLAGVF